MLDLLTHPHKQRTALALGFFDGVHMGHRRVIAKAVELAGQELLPGVFTFSAQRELPRAKQGRAALCTPVQKIELLGGAGAKCIATPDFTSIKDMSPEQFVRDMLVGKLRAAWVCCGEDFRFGTGARGDVEALISLGRKCGMQVEVVQAVYMDGQPVSSTRIRRAIMSGELSAAAEMLGRGYSISATVVEGKKLGRTLSFPTVNQPLPTDLALPPHGVYAAWIKTPDGVYHKGVCNLGRQPTVGGDTLLAETHILGFEGDLYGKTLDLMPMVWLRDIQKFSSLDRLRTAVQENMAQAEKLLSLPEYGHKIKK